MNKKGYTLVEILAIVFIIFIISLVSFPTFRNYTQNLEVKGSTEKLLSHIKLAQQYTVSEQVKYAIRITPLSNTYYLIKKTEPEEVIETYSLDNKVYFANNIGIQNNEVSFNFGGGVDYAGQIFITHLYTEITALIDIKPSGYVNWQKQ